MVAIVVKPCSVTDFGIRSETDNFHFVIHFIVLPYYLATSKCGMGFKGLGASGGRRKYSIIVVINHLPNIKSLDRTKSCQDVLESVPTQPSLDLVQSSRHYTARCTIMYTFVVSKL